MAVKKFDTLAVIGLVSGVLLKKGGFGAIHEVAEWVAGHPIWTHEFAITETQKRLWDAVLKQHPRLESLDLGDVTPTNANEKAQALLEQYGAEMELAQGDGRRETDPITTAVNLMGENKC